VGWEGGRQEQVLILLGSKQFSRDWIKTINIKMPL